MSVVCFSPDKEVNVWNLQVKANQQIQLESLHVFSIPFKALKFIGIMSICW